MKRAILAAFKESMRVNELATALEIWNKYEQIMTSNSLIM